MRAWYRLIRKKNLKPNSILPIYMDDNRTKFLGNAVLIRKAPSSFYGNFPILTKEITTMFRDKPIKMFFQFRKERWLVEFIDGNLKCKLHTGYIQYYVPNVKD